MDGFLSSSLMHPLYPHQEHQQIFSRHINLASHNTYNQNPFQDIYYELLLLKEIRCISCKDDETVFSFPIQVWADSTTSCIPTPMLPILPPFLGIRIHDANVDRSPRSSQINFEIRPVDGLNSLEYPIRKGEQNVFFLP